MQITELTFSQAHPPHWSQKIRSPHQNLKIHRSQSSQSSIIASQGTTGIRETYVKTAKHLKTKQLQTMQHEKQHGWPATMFSICFCAHLPKKCVPPLAQQTKRATVKQQPKPNAIPQLTWHKVHKKQKKRQQPWQLAVPSCKHVTASMP